MASVKRIEQRPYDNADRRARSAATRVRILEAARELIGTKGYRAATVAEIARGAGVHVDTVYELVGRKPAVLRTLIELAISGGTEPVEPDERDYVAAMRAEPDPGRKLGIYADAVRTIHTRLAPLHLALRDAATTEPEAAAIWQEINARRARNMRRLVAELGPAGTLRAGVTVEDAADIVWATASAELFILLTTERGWTLDHYAQWLADSWRRLLLARAGDEADAVPSIGGRSPRPPAVSTGP